MTIQTTDRRAEEDTTKTGHHRRGGGIRSGENLKQKNSTGKEKVLGAMEGIYGRRGHVGE